MEADASLAHLILGNFGFLASVQCPLLAEAVEELFEGLKSRLLDHQQKLDSNKINSLEVRQFGIARQLRLKTAYSGVLQQPRLKADIPRASKNVRSTPNNGHTRGRR